MDNNNDLMGIKAKIEAMQKEMQKVLNNNIGKLSDVLKMAEYKSEKKGRVNKKMSTMYLAHDNSVRIKFDNPEDGEAFFNSFK
ncbi:MAG: hypothetical protein ACHQ1D_00270 [Nitrososphaerales archaeon]